MYNIFNPVAMAAVCSKAAILLMLINYLLLFPLCVGLSVWSLFCDAGPEIIKIC